MSTRQYAVAQQLSTDALVELYQLDTTSLTALNGVLGLGSVYHWTPGTIGNAPVSLAGVAYTPMQIEGSGFDWNGQGKLPQPTLKISNINGLASALSIEFNQLLGAEVTRTLIFARFLDGGAEADPSASFRPETYVINRKSSHSKAEIAFELRASFDAQGVQLPRRQVIRNACPLTYRAYNTATGQFVPGTCPWVGVVGGGGTPWYDLSGNLTYDPTKDACGKKLSDCVVRFQNTGSAPQLPFGGFPGVGITPQ